MSRSGSAEQRSPRGRRWNPVARLGAIKLKLGALIVGGAAVTTGALVGADAVGIPVWLAVSIATGLGLVTIDLLGTGLTAPLRQMAEQADRLAAGEQVDPVDDAAADEVGELARAFNRMAREVAHTDRVRRELVANVSHELRTPLAAMSAVVENLVDGIADPTPDRLRTLEAQTGRLRSLVDQLLDLSQLDAGAVRLERAPVDPWVLVAEAVTICGDGAGDRVVTEVDPAVARLDVDRDRFVQVLVNLLGNALRHGPDGEPVTVAVSRDGHDAVVVVTDTGPGIAPEDAERVFDRFARTDAGRAAAVGGAGLGLPIVRWIVQLHGGTAHVETHDGVGARLRIDLPGAAVGAAVAPDDVVPLSERVGRAATSDAHVSDAASGPPSDPIAAVEDHHMRSSLTGPEPLPAPPVPVPGDDGAGRTDPLRLLPTPVAGLQPRGIAAVIVAAVVAALVGVGALDGRSGLGMVVLLGVVGIATLWGREEPMDGFGWTCAIIALGVVATHAWTDAMWVLVPGTLVATLVAGLGLWGPTRAGEVLRALVVGPLLTIVTPLALARGVRTGDASQLRRWIVPAAGTVAVLLVFGGLLVQGDAAVATVVDAVLPDLALDVTLVLRVVLAGVAAVVVSTYLLVQRAGRVETTPWRRPTRPRADWLVPVVVLDVLLVVAIVVRAGVLFGGDERVRATTGLTYAEYARSGFGALLALAALVLVVVGIVARVAADADRRARDRALGVLLAATAVMVVSAFQRLSLYTAEFGLSRLRFSAFVAIGFVAVVIALVALAGRSRSVAAALPRTLVVLVGLTVLGVAIVRPDALIARQQINAFGATAELDVAYLSLLSADAAPIIAQLPDELLVTTGDPYLDTDWCGLEPGGVDWTRWNASRAEARTVTREIGPCATGAG